MGCSNTLPVVYQQSSLPALTYADDTSSKDFNVSSLSQSQDLVLTCSQKYTSLEASIDNDYSWQSITQYSVSSVDYKCEADETITVQISPSKLSFSSTASSQVKKVYIRGLNSDGYSSETIANMSYSAYPSITVGFGSSSLTRAESNTSAYSLTIQLSQAPTATSYRIPITLTSLTSGLTSSDYSLSGSDLKGSSSAGYYVLFAAGETTKTLSLSVVNDSDVESTEQLKMALSTNSITNLTLNGSGEFILTITDNDQAAIAFEGLTGTSLPIAAEYRVASNASVTLRNNGISTAQSVILTLPSTSVFTFTSGGTITNGGHTLTCSNLSNNQTCVVNIRITATDVGTFTDTVSLSYTDSSASTYTDSFTVNATVSAQTVTVAKISASYSNWGSYYQNASPSSACTGNEGGPYYDASDSNVNCKHGGLARQVTTMETSCTGLTMTDNLGAFDWSCSVVSSVAVFTLSGFKSGKGLRDLINFSTTVSWQNNYISIVKSSNTLYQSASSAWWTNTLSALSASSSEVTLNSSGTIYYADSNITLSSLRINTSNVSLVTKAGTEISFSVSSDNCDVVGNLTNDSPDRRCGIHSREDFLWIEANLNANSAAHIAVLLVGSEFTVVHKSAIRANASGAPDATYGGVVSLGSDSSLLSSVSISNFYGSALLFDETSTNNSSSYVIVDNPTVDNSANLGSTTQGIYLGTGTNNFTVNSATLTNTAIQDSGSNNTIN